MRRILGLLFVFVCAAGALQPALAQKNAPAITRDSDRDGVMDPRDRCRGTAAGTRVDANGCPAAAAPAPAAAAPASATPPATAPLTNQATQPRPDTTHRANGAVLGAAAPAGAAAPPGGPPPGTQQAAEQPPNNTTRGTPPAGSTPAPVTAAPSAPAPAAGAPSPGIAGAAGAAVASAATPNQPAATPAHPAATAPAPAPMAVTDPTETAGFWLPAYTGRTDAEQLAYAKTLVIKLDSAVVALVETYRNTSGTPVAGASDPGRLTSREKARWLRCRNIGNDMHTIADAASVLKDSIAGGPAVQRGAAALADAFTAMQAVEGCDVINGMIESPDRVNPWQQNYENEARSFYRDWYGQVRAVHTAARELARVLNGVLPAAQRFPIPAAIPTTPPYIGAVR